MGNSILFNTAGSIALAINYVIQGPYSDKFLSKQAATTLRINSEVYVRVDDVVFCIDTDVDLVPATHLDAGASFDATDTYYVYACHPLDGTLDPVFRMSKNATFPAGGWDATNSRKIGGFDTDGSAEISEATIWDLRTVEVGSSASTDHDASHVRGGTDEMDGDHLDIDLTPYEYSPDTSHAEAGNEDDLSAHLAGLDNAQLVPKTLVQGIKMTAAAAASNGIVVDDDADLDNGTADFAIYWHGRVADWTPSANKILAQKHDGANGWILTLLTTGVLRLTLNATNYDSTVAVNRRDNTEAMIGVSVTRETASVAGSVVFTEKGVAVGASVAITAGAPTTVTNAVPLYILGTSATRVEGVINTVILFNRAMTATEHLTLVRNGIPYADQWGSKTAVYSSNFGAGEDGWTASQGTVAGNIDAIGGEDDWLRYTVNGDLNNHYFSKTALTAGKAYRVTARMYLPSTNSNMDCVKLGGAGTGTNLKNMNVYSTPTPDTIFSMTCEFISAATSFAIFTGDGGVQSYQDAGGNDVIYVKDVVIEEIGAVMALEPEGIQPSPGQWLDSSSNNLHALQPASGSSTTRRIKTFELRDTLTWAGTHEAQYIGANQSVLPANCYIDTIIGVITGATIEDIIIGDGSDTDRWVAITTGLATGTVSFTLANRISDGTNYKMVVDPDANFTGSIAFTIKGSIIESV